jgi:hypothetical protein
MRVDGTAAEGKDALTSTGNKLSREGNVQAKRDNERLIDTIQRNATSRGPLSDALSDAARDLAGGKSVPAVVSQFLGKARGLVRSGQSEGLQSGAPAGRDGTQEGTGGGGNAAGRPVEPATTGTIMPNAMRELYRSSNGDRWSLIRDDQLGKVLVLHEPNAASGGRPSRLEVGDFLVRDAHGPQHAELLRLIGTLIGKIDGGGSPI